nr:hypothetical protein [Tanacetum cinerariifolium]
MTGNISYIYEYEPYDVGYVSHGQRESLRKRWTWIETTDQETKIIATVDGKPRTISESSLRRHLKLNDKEGISSLPDAELFENLLLMGYNILPSQRDGRHREAFPTVSSLDAWQDRENIAKTSTMSHESSPRVPSLDADEGTFSTASVSAADVFPTAGVPTVSGSFPTVSAIFTTSSMATPYTRRSREQIDAQVAREMEEEFARKNQRLSEQAVRDSKIARIHAEENLKLMIEGLDRSNEVIAKHLSEYEQAEADLSIEEEIKLINEPASPLGDDSQGEACPIVSGLEAEQDRANIIKSSTLPHDSTPTVTSLAADEGTSLKAKIKMLEDKDGGVDETSEEDATIKGRSLETREEEGVEKSTKKDSNDTEELRFPLKKRLQEQIDVQKAREMEEQLAREDQRMNEQIARDAKIARIHAEEELQMLIDSLDRNNETVAKYLQEYEQFAADFSIGERIELINDLVKY